MGNRLHNAFPKTAVGKCPCLQMSTCSPPVSIDVNWQSPAQCFSQDCCRQMSMPTDVTLLSTRVNRRQLAIACTMLFSQDCCRQMSMPTDVTLLSTRVNRRQLAIACTMLFPRLLSANVHAYRRHLALHPCSSASTDNRLHNYFPKTAVGKCPRLQMSTCSPPVAIGVSWPFCVSIEVH